MSDEATTMAVCLAREINEADLVGIGLGTPLALAAALLARRTHARGAHLFTGGMVVRPQADLLSITLGASALAGRFTGFVSHLETMEMAERQRMTLQFLRPAEVDGSGNINTSRIVGADGALTRLPGGLASADVPKLLPRLVLYHTDHRLRSLPAAVSFITGAGGGDPDRGAAGPVRLITNRAVFSFECGRARLHSVHPGHTVEEVLESTGFRCDVEGVVQTDEPTAFELEQLRIVDELELAELEFRSTRRAAAARLARALAQVEIDDSRDVADPQRACEGEAPPTKQRQETRCQR